MIKSDDDIADLKYCIDKTSSDKDLSNKDTLWNTVENNEHYCTVGGKVGFFFITVDQMKGREFANKIWTYILLQNHLFCYLELFL